VSLYQLKTTRKVLSVLLLFYVRGFSCLWYLQRHRGWNGEHPFILLQFGPTRWV